MEYIVNWPYRSSYGGPWQAGDRVTLTAEHAAQINRDSPGVLSPSTPPAAQDRMVKAGRTRKRGADGDEA